MSARVTSPALQVVLRLTFPKQMSSTICGSKLLFLTTCSKILNTMPSSGVSFRPPFLPFASGVRIARVMTISSGFFWVLQNNQACQLLSCPIHVKAGALLAGKQAERRNSHLVQRLLAGGQLGDNVGESLGGHDEDVFLG